MGILKAGEFDDTIGFSISLTRFSRSRVRPWAKPLKSQKGWPMGTRGREPNGTIGLPTPSLAYFKVNYTKVVSASKRSYSNNRQVMDRTKRYLNHRLALASGGMKEYRRLTSSCWYESMSHMYSRRIWKGSMCVVLESSHIMPKMEKSLRNKLQYKCQKNCVCIVVSGSTRSTISRGSSESARRALLVILTKHAAPSDI
jgi:hypothetical protein